MPDTLTIKTGKRLQEWVLLSPNEYKHMLACLKMPTRTLAEVKDMMIANALRHCNGDRRKAAKLLDIGERTMYRHVKRLKMEGLI